MKILLVADLHGALDVLDRMIITEAPDVVLGVGDITEYWLDDFAVPTYMIFGNHEHWQMINYVRDPNLLTKQKIKNLTVLETGRIYDVSGIKVAGLNGNFATYPRKPWHVVMADVETCKLLHGIDFFLSHEPPQGVADVLYNGKHVGNEHVRIILDRIKPKVMACGHIHHAQMKEHDGTTVITLGKGKHGFYAIFENSVLKQKKLES